MSRPFFIWTLRRTGGTTLTDLLMSLSEHPHTEHEPFLIDRALGDITRAYMSSKYKVAESKLRSALEKGTLIKHCYEVLGEGFNDFIFQIIKEYPHYRHILLLRQNETNRMLSLMLAFQTDVWGKHGSEWVYEQIRSGQKSLEPFDMQHLRNEEENAIHQTRHIKELLRKENVDYMTIYFEELYQGSKSERLERLSDIFEYLEFEPSVIDSRQREIHHMIFERSQNSRSVLEYVPNIETAREVLDQYPGRETIIGTKDSHRKKSTIKKKESPVKSPETITLYLGAHKTATTHLQGILHANRERLADRGIKLSMPGDVRKEWLPAFFHYCSHKDDASRAKIDELAPDKGTWLLTEENIAGVSNDFTHKSGIYPHVGARLKCLRKAWPDSEMRLFFSLRSYETFYRSAYSEVVRNRGYIPFDQFYDEERFRGNSWVETVRQFIEVIPQEKITLWRYEDFRQLVPSILRSMTGIENTEAMIAAYHAETTRPSLSQKTIDILDSLYPVLERKESKKLVERINEAYPVSKGYASLRTFSDEQEKVFRKQYEEDVERIKKEFPRINFLMPEEK